MSVHFVIVMAVNGCKMRNCQ